jgi:hypothetical protein
MWVDMVGKLKELLCFRIIDCSGRFLSRTSKTTCSMRNVCSHWVGGGGTFATAAAATGKAAAGEADDLAGICYALMLLLSWHGGGIR